MHSTRKSTADQVATFVNGIHNNDYAITKSFLANIVFLSAEERQRILSALMQDNLSVCAPYFLMHFYASSLEFSTTPSISDSEREARVIHYGMLAIERGSDEAFQFLVNALIKGQSGIKPSKVKIKQLYESDSLKKNQYAAYEYGCYCLGLLPNLEEIPKVLSHFQFPDINPKKGIEALTKALNGNNPTITNLAFTGLCKYYLKNYKQDQKFKSVTQNHVEDLIQIFNTAVNKSPFPQILALYMAYIYCPKDILVNLNLPSQLNLSEYLDIFQEFIPSSMDKTKKYLVIAASVPNQYANLAQILFERLDKSCSIPMMRV